LVTMNITRGPFSANVEPIYVAGRRQGEFQVVVSRYGTPLYERLEGDFEEALRLAKAYVDWELDNYTDT